MSSGKGSDGLCDIPRIYGTRKERHDLATICRDMDNLGTACCSILPSARCPAIACAGWTCWKRATEYMNHVAKGCGWIFAYLVWISVAWMLIIMRFAT